MNTASWSPPLTLEELQSYDIDTGLTRASGWRARRTRHISAWKVSRFVGQYAAWGETEEEAIANLIESEKIIYLLSPPEIICPPNVSETIKEKITENKSTARYPAYYGEGMDEETFAGVKRMEALFIKRAIQSGSSKELSFYNEYDPDNPLSEDATSDWFDIGDR